MQKTGGQGRRFCFIPVTFRELCLGAESVGKNLLSPTQGPAVAL